MSKGKQKLSKKFVETRKKRRACSLTNHVQAEQPLIPAGSRGWWRMKHVLAFYGVSESEYRRGAKAGRYRKPDTYRGRIPVWSAEKF